MPTSAHPIARCIAAGALLCGASAFAHVALPPGGATAGSDYEAAFRVGHACQGAKATTGLTVRLPPQGFTLLDVPARTGWKIERDAGTVRWTADSAASALPADQPAEFVLRGRLGSTPGPLYFKVLQHCDTGSTDWAQLPSGAAGEKLPLPAARLDVLPPGVAAVHVQDGWVRASVPGQRGTGAFMKLQAPAGARLVAVESPAAGVAEVHEMKLEGDVMRMRAVDALPLPPRQTVELKPGGYHVMLMDLKQALPAGSTVPLTLRFKDAAGADARLEVELPVRSAPAQAAAGAGHRH
ncbi:copper chaperone PCu(A)C [Pseudorhodoferax sp.]|uniref:copper chaperone PCu(A)C n=1 Tax=Pseudorhodoferax sp. TaxID=1993553 RepID=UPI0039E2F887